VNGPPEGVGPFVADIFCDACGNSGVCDYGNGLEPCRSVVHRHNRGVSEQTDDASGGTSTVPGPT
jgi:hypothetical protein